MNRVWQMGLIALWGSFLAGTGPAVQAADHYTIHFPLEYSYDNPEPQDIDSIPRREMGIRVSLVALKDGRFSIGGTIAWLPGREPDFDGYGRFDKKGGLFRFTFDDSFENKGVGTLQLLDHGKKAILTMEATQVNDGGRASRQYGIYRLILDPPKTNQPAPLSRVIVTEPGHFRIKLEGDYAIVPGTLKHDSTTDFTYITFYDYVDGTIRVRGEIDLRPEYSLTYAGHGEFKSGDRFVFTFGDRDENKGVGTMQFTDADTATLSLKITHRSDGKPDREEDKILQQTFRLKRPR